MGLHGVRVPGLRQDLQEFVIGQKIEPAVVVLLSIQIQTNKQRQHNSKGVDNKKEQQLQQHKE